MMSALKNLYNTPSTKTLGLSVFPPLNHIIDCTLGRSRRSWCTRMAQYNACQREKLKNTFYGQYLRKSSVEAAVSH